VTFDHAALRDRAPMRAYEISVRGLLDPGMAEALGALTVEELPARTVLHAEVGDDAGLDDVLRRLSALGIEFLEAREVGEERASR
jgi:hypothetical protein